MHLLESRNLRKYFVMKRGLFGERIVVRAVDGVDFHLDEGKTLGIVGESGSGKTTVGRLVLRLIKPTSGEVYFMGKDVFSLAGRELQELRRRMQIVFQDPFASLNPRKKVRHILSRPIQIYGLVPSGEIESRLLELLGEVGFSQPEHVLDRYPHELSGGQRQRIGVARAIVTRPNFIVADEPVSSLDVSIRGTVLNLLKDLQRKLTVAYLLISHDLGIVRSMANDIAVMYLGVICEKAERTQLCENPLHPYTKLLLSAYPILDPKVARTRQRSLLGGDIPSSSNLPSGCRFHTRCPLTTDKCHVLEPQPTEVESGHWVRCHAYRP